MRTMYMHCWALVGFSGIMGLEMKVFSIRQIAIGIPALMLLNWAVLQFAVLPRMNELQRREIYPEWVPWHSLFVLCTVFIGFAFWFVFIYRGPVATPEKRSTLFAMALASLSGMLLIIALRHAWHI